MKQHLLEKDRNLVLVSLIQDCWATSAKNMGISKRFQSCVNDALVEYSFGGVLSHLINTDQLSHIRCRRI